MCHGSALLFWILSGFSVISSEDSHLAGLIRNAPEFDWQQTETSWKDVSHSSRLVTPHLPLFRISQSASRRTLVWFNRYMNATQTKDNQTNQKQMSQDVTQKRTECSNIPDLSHHRGCKPGLPTLIIWRETRAFRLFFTLSLYPSHAKLATPLTIWNKVTVFKCCMFY